MRYKCNCGERLTGKVEDIIEDALDHCSPAGDEVEEEIQCEKCGSIYRVDIDISVFVNMMFLRQEIDEDMIEPGRIYQYGGKLRIYDENKQLAEEWSPPNDKQTALF